MVLNWRIAASYRFDYVRDDKRVRKLQNNAWKKDSYNLCFIRITVSLAYVNSIQRKKKSFLRRVRERQKITDRTSISPIGFVLGINGLENENARLDFGFFHIFFVDVVVGLFLWFFLVALSHVVFDDPREASQHAKIDRGQVRQTDR